MSTDSMAHRKGQVMSSHPAIRRVRKFLEVLTAGVPFLAALMGCATEPITGRSQLALLPESVANEMGVQAFAEILGEAKLSVDPLACEQAVKVGMRIASATDARMTAEGRELYHWEIHVIDDPKTANAFALPGGKIAVYTGILPIARDDAGLAVVLGHEVAHAYAQHGRKRISEALIEELGVAAVAEGLDGNVSPEVEALIIAGLGIGLSLGLVLPFSRGDESAADEIGLFLMAEAGYDPREAVGFWQRLEASSGEGPPEFLSTHPSPENRIARIQELLPKVMEVYSGASRLPAW